MRCLFVLVAARGYKRESPEEDRMRIIKPVIATALTEGIITAGLWKMGTFPVWYVMIEVSSYGFLPLAGMFFLLTWALMVLWLLVLNRSSAS